MTSTLNEHICRLCANHGIDYHSIFDTGAIVEKIHNCLPVVIKTDDKLPSHICNPCLDALEISDKLRTQCLRADSILRKQLKVILIQDIKCEKEPISIKNEKDDDFDGSNEDNNESQWTCELCADIFVTSDDLLAHKNEMHTTETVFIKEPHTDENSGDENETVAIDQMNVDDEDIEIAPLHFVDPDQQDGTCCSICQVTINDKKLMELHMEMHKPRELSCCYCYVVMPTPYNLYLHKKATHRLFLNEEIKWFCEKCLKLIGSIAAIRSHQKQCSKAKYSCQYCSKEFVYRRQLLPHQKRYHYETIIKDPEIEKFKCDTCGKSYFDPITYKRHLKMHHAIQNELYKCTQCDKVFSSSSNLQNHLQVTHNREQKFECDVCSKAFWGENQLRAHKRKHNKCHCKQCGEEFESLKILDQHALDVHHSRAPTRAEFKCNECGAVFRKTRLLKDHENIHTGKEPYSCEICEKKFRTYAAHWAHSQKHRQLTFFCDYCGQEYVDKKNLKKHIPTHQEPEEWHYHCQMCDIKFPNFSRLQRHLEKYSETHLRTCHLCGHKVLGDERLKRHMNLKHDIWDKNKDDRPKKKKKKKK